MFFDDDRVRDWLDDIITNCERISTYVNGLTVEQFTADEKTIDAVERCLQRISEAAVRIGEERPRQVAPDLPIQQVRGLGKILRHHHDRIDPKLIWNTAAIDLAPLRRACEEALSVSGWRADRLP
ncbi:MAG TPA: HepT-like ribonuclease domain-containing protein [Allosphingosinicella sp.]|jgi:uncharacterized protein with HEPN domain